MKIVEGESGIYALTAVIAIKALTAVIAIIVSAVLYLVAGWIYWTFIYAPAPVPPGVHVEYWFMPSVIWLELMGLASVIWLGLMGLVGAITYGVWKIYVKRIQ